MNTNPKIAIFDLTDCEGCELQFLSMQEKLTEMAKDFDILAWRLVEPSPNPVPKVDIAIIQGTVITQKDIEIVKQIRENAKFLVALGECARTGWIPSWIKKEDQAKAIKYVYNDKYMAKRVDAVPIKSIVKIDKEIGGCPPEIKLIEDFLNNIPTIVNKE